MTLELILYIIFVMTYLLLATYRAYDNYYYKDMDLAQAIIPTFLRTVLISILIYFIIF